MAGPNKKTKEKVENLIGELSTNESESRLSRIHDNITEVELVTLDFIKHRFNKLESDTELENLIISNLKGKVERDEIGVDKMMTLLNQLKLRNAESVESLLSFFKNAENSRNTLLDNNSMAEADTISDIQSSVDPRTLRELQKLINIIQTTEKMEEVN
jgi:hypothetical protein